MVLYIKTFKFKVSDTTAYWPLSMLSLFQFSTLF